MTLALGAAGLAAGCQGPRILEWDGGAETSGAAGGGGGAGSAGSGGGAGSAGVAGGAGGGGATGGRAGSSAAGRGGTGGAGRGGAGGGGCAAQMQPQMFHRGNYGPAVSEGTSTRYYWVEQTSPRITIHYSEGEPAAHVKHMYEVDPAGVAPWDVAIDDQRVVAKYALDSKISVYGPNATSAQIGTTMTLGRAYGITVAGTTVFYSHDPMGGSPTPGIYQWSPPAAPALFASYTTLGGSWTAGHILRATPNKLLLSDTTDVFMVDRAAPGARQILFENPTKPSTKTVIDIRPARPRTTDGGVIVSLQDPAFNETGHDYFVDVSRPTVAPKDLAQATTALANASACGAVARYRGAGVLYNRRYIYEGQQGLFAVDIDTNGDASNLVRLTDIPLSRVEVTGEGYVFAGWVFNVGYWDYHRVGKL